MPRRLGVLAASIAVVELLSGGLASAHIEPDPVAIQAGTAATVGFNVEHGCDGSPTTQIAIKVPDGVTDAQPVQLDGWTATAADGAITFSGGSQDAETPAVFSITFTAPSTAGEIYFPILQTCAEGENDWLEIPDASGTEPETPAPAVLVTEGAPTAEQLTPPADDDDDEATDATDTAPTASAVIATAAPTSTDGGSSTDTGTVVGVIIAIVVLAGAAGVVIVVRRRR
jgi:uncharacterized protein YcnI